jgi:transposase
MSFLLDYYNEPKISDRRLRWISPDDTMNENRGGEMRKRYDKAFKARVALEAIRGEKTVQQIALEFEVHPNLVGLWKKQLLAGAAEIFEKPNTKAEEQTEKKTDELYRQIGELQVEKEFLKKKYKQLYGREPEL